MEVIEREQIIEAIRKVPDDCLPEIYNFIDYTMWRFDAPHGKPSGFLIRRSEPVLSSILKTEFKRGLTASPKA